VTFSSFPFENADTDESQYTLLLREFAGTGVLDSQLGGGLLVTGSGSALTVSIAAGNAIVRAAMAMNDAPVSQSINANASGVTRVDRLVLKLDPAANSIVPLYKVGAASPPTLTQTDTGVYEMPLARITVANGATNLAGAVIDERPFADMRMGIWSTATRPGTAGYGPTPRRGQPGLNVTTGRWEYYNGSAWVDLIPAVTAVSTWTSMEGAGFQLSVGSSAPSSPTATTLWIKPTA
jgi:hypothetical protein